MSTNEYAEFKSSNNNNNNNNNNLVPNNNYKDCPALMSDGRFITNYKPNCEMNNTISTLFDNKPLTSWEYTYYLINKAGKVHDFVNDQYNKQYGCTAYPYKIIDPELKQDCNTDNCVIRNVNPKGMGI